jgi:hypothetical protein
LKYKDEIGVVRKNTPAREAGITDSKWTLKNLRNYSAYIKQHPAPSL